MIINVEQMLINTFTNLFENVFWFVPIAFIVAIYLFFFRFEIAYNLELTKREYNRLTEKSLFAITMIAAVTITYLYIKGYYFFLFLSLSLILIILLYRVGILEMIVEKLEGKYGR